MKNILIVLVNYGEEQLQYLQQVVTELKSFKNYKVSIIVNSNIPLDIEGIDQVNIIELDDYQLLPLTCRQVIWDHRDDFDVFLFGENDHLFKEYHIDRHLEYINILPSDKISGLLQYEQIDEKLYFPAWHASYDWDYNNIEEYGGEKVCTFFKPSSSNFYINQGTIE